MAQIDLQSVYRVRAKGRDYFYAWKGRGAPRLYEKPGSAEFVRELNAALASRNTGDKTKIDGLIIEYKARGRYRDLADSTKKIWAIWLDRIRDHFGKLSIRQFDRATIRTDIKQWRAKWHDQPRSADYGIQVLSALLSSAVDDGKLGSNPCFGIAGIYSANRADIIWTDADLAKLAEHASPEIFRAAKLAALTGLRRGDLLRLRWDAIGDSAIEQATGKSGGRRTAQIPLYGELREFLATCPRTAGTVLTSSRGTAWAGWGTGWTDAMHDSGLMECDLHFHDLRGTAATKFYLAGFTIREISVVLAWAEDRVERLIDRYVKRDEILREKIARMDAARQSA